MATRDVACRETILAMIGHIRRCVDDAEHQAFCNDGDKLDLKAFRLPVIGETASKLDDATRRRHPDVPWRALQGFQNLVSHDDATIAPRFDRAATRELDPSKSCASPELEWAEG